MSSIFILQMTISHYLISTNSIALLTNKMLEKKESFSTLPGMALFLSQRFISTSYSPLFIFTRA